MKIKSAYKYTWKMETCVLALSFFFLIYLALKVTEVSEFVIDLRVQLTDCKMNISHYYNRWNIKLKCAIVIICRT